jgi:hypothetical protein
MVSALVRKQSPDITTTKRILSYFVRHPMAADSLEGVVRWRVMDEFVRMNVDETHAALGWLVAEGYLTKVTSPGSDAIFQLNPDHVADAERFLDKQIDGAERQGGDSSRHTPAKRRDSD